MFLLVHSQGSSCFANFGALEAGITLPVMLPDMPLLVIPPLLWTDTKNSESRTDSGIVFSRVDPFVDFEGRST